MPQKGIKSNDTRDIELARDKNEFNWKMLNFNMGFKQLLNMFRKFGKITIRLIALLIFRTIALHQKWFTLLVMALNKKNVKQKLRFCTCTGTCV